MATPIERTARLLLPSRINVDHALSDTVSPRILLAERLADFPDILTVDDDSDTPLGGVELLFAPDGLSVRKHAEPIRFCRIDHAGIRISHISDWDKYQVVSKRWGTLEGTEVLLFLPRSLREAEVCWDVLSRAHDFLIEERANVRHKRMAASWHLPHYSRTRFH